MSLTGLIYLGLGFASGMVAGIYMAERHGVTIQDVQTVSHRAINRVRLKMRQSQPENVSTYGNR
jgi:hypothetical protein